jgi:hypothetical protein
LGKYPDGFENTTVTVSTGLPTPITALSYSTQENKYVACCEDNASFTIVQTATSTDLVTWSVTTLDGGVGERFNNGNVNAIIRTTGAGEDGRKLIFVGKNGQYMIANSINLGQLNLISTGTANDLNAIVYTNFSIRKYTAVGQNGVMVTAENSDGSGLTVRASGTSSSLYSIIKQGSTAVYAGAGGVLATSVDGITWTARTTGTTSTIYALAYTDSTYMYAGAGGVMATSTDAVTWSTVSSGTTSTIYKLVGENGIFVYLDAAGKIGFSSTKGQNWTIKQTGKTDIPNIVFEANNKLVYANSYYMNSCTPFSYDYQNDFILPKTVRTTINDENLYIKS